MVNICLHAISIKIVYEENLLRFVLKIMLVPKIRQLNNNFYLYVA